MGMGHIIFETDCLNLQHTITSNVFDDAAVGVLFRDVRCLLQLSFLTHAVMHCTRTCNKPAHELASLGAAGAYGSQVLWLSDVPSDVLRLVAGDSVES